VAPAAIIRSLVTVADGFELVTVQARLIGQGGPMSFGVGLVGRERRHAPGAGRRYDQRDHDENDQRQFVHNGRSLSAAE
jgi:hypothetical protein